MSNKSPYWFSVKRYGYGWGLPCRWEGWAVFISWFLAVILAARYLAPGHRIGFRILMVLMVAVLILVCYWKGEPTSWRWGDRK
jgi:hypothetical protein